MIATGVRNDHIITVDLEDRRNRSLRNPDELLQYIDCKIADSEMHYVLLDEIQLVDEFEDVLNSYLKVPNVDVYVTGSNSRFLSTDVITEFRGRGDEIRIAPLSFSEFMSTQKNMSQEKAFVEYSTYGGLPIVALTDDPKKKSKYLKDLFAKTYLTDIRERYKIKNDSDLEDLINIMASSIGSLTNPTKIANTFTSVKQSPISHNTVKSYLDMLQDAFLLSKAVRYDIKGRKYIGTPAKYYFTDMGLRNARINFRQVEMTHIMENIIYNELLLRGMDVDIGVLRANVQNANSTNQRQQWEVDFVCNEGSKRCYIQSAYRFDNQEKVEQEIRSLRGIDDSFMKIIITESPTVRHQNDDGILFMDIYDFLLDSNSLNF